MFFRTQKSFSRPYYKTKNDFRKCRSNIFIMHLKNCYYPAVHQRQFSFTMKLRYISSKRSWEENLIKWRDSSHFQHLRSWRHFYDMADEAAAGCCSKQFRLWNSKKSMYRIVASTNTCYYSENQIFCFLKSRILTIRIFFWE